MLRGCQAGHQAHRSLGEPTLRGLSAAAENAKADFHCCGSSQERPRQDPARPPAGGLDRTHEGFGMSTRSPAQMLSCRAKARHPVAPRLAFLLRCCGLLDRPPARVMTADRSWNFATEICGLVATLAFAFVSATTLQAEDLWRHGTLVPKGDAGFIYMAAEGGFAKAEGLDLKMQAFQNDTLMIKALIAGELDSYEGSPISPLIAGSRGADVKILGCTWPKLTYSLFSHDGIGTIGDLKGKKIGISAPGSLPDVVARAMLKQAGILPSEVSFVAAGSDPERVRALMAKTIDAAISTSDFAARPELKLKTLAIASEALPQFMRQCVITRGDLIRSKRTQLVAFVAAEMKAYGFAFAHRDKVVA